MIKMIYTIDGNNVTPRKVINKSSRGGYITKGGKEFLIHECYKTEKEARKVLEERRSKLNEV